MSRRLTNLGSALAKVAAVVIGGAALLAVKALLLGADNVATGVSRAVGGGAHVADDAFRSAARLSDELATPNAAVSHAMPDDVFSRHIAADPLTALDDASQSNAAATDAAQKGATARPPQYLIQDSEPPHSTSAASILSDVAQEAATEGATQGLEATVDSMIHSAVDRESSTEDNRP
jgi:hypothetical protein